MSFLSILKKVGKVALGVSQNPIVDTALHAFVPGYARVDPLLEALQSNIITVEQNATLENGQLKSQAVSNEFNAYVHTFQESLALVGKKLTYDESLLQATIDAQVLVYNNFKKLKDSFKVVDL